MLNAGHAGEKNSTAKRTVIAGNSNLGSTMLWFFQYGKIEV
jgi:hypothetical protein